MNNTNKHLFTSVLCILLCLLFLTQPLALAEGEPAAPPDEPTEQAVAQETEPEPTAEDDEPLAFDNYDAIRTEQNELTELRTANSKTYDLGGDARQLVLYADDVHYQDGDGGFLDIENDIIQSSSRIGDRAYAYKNAANSYSAHFSQDASSDLVYLEYEGKGMTITPVFSMPDDGTITLSDEPTYEPGQALPSEDEAQGEAEPLPEQPMDEAAIAPQAPCTAQPLSEQPFSQSEALNGLIIPQNSIRYENIMPDIDLIYETKNHELKEYIVLKQPTDINEFYFDYTLKGLTPDTSDGLRFLDESGEEVFSTPALFAIDAAGALTENVTAELVSYENDVARIKVTLDPSYLNNTARSFPIVIDPSQMVTGSGDTYDTDVSSLNPTKNYYTSTLLKIGKTSTNNIYRAFIKFKMDGITVTPAQVDSAYIRFKFYSGDTPRTLYARRLIKNWTSSTLTWNNSQDITTTESGVQNTSGMGRLDGDNWYVMRVNMMVKNILSGKRTNYGWRIKDKTAEANKESFNLYSSDCGTSNRPQLVINYSSAEGSNAALVGLTMTEIKNNETVIIDNTSAFPDVTTKIKNLGYGTVSKTTGYTTESNIKNILNKNSNGIVVLSSHGSAYPQTGTQAGTKMILDGSSENDVNRELLKSSTSLSSLDLSNLKLAIFVSCESGKGGAGGKNLPTVTVNKGAKAAIGFKRIIDAPSANTWLKEYFGLLNSQEVTISKACKNTCKRPEFQGDPGLWDYTFCGSDNANI